MENIILNKIKEDDTKVTKILLTYPTNAEQINNEEHTKSHHSKISLFLNGFIQFLLFAATSVITLKAFNMGILLYSWHIALMAIGYLILMTQAVFTISGSTFFTSSLKHRSRVFVHWLLQTLAGILITIAVVSIFINKIYQERLHFQSIHAIFGLIAYCLTMVSIVGGVFTKYSVRFRTKIPPVYTKIFHVALGIVAYTVSIVATMLGFYSPWFTKNSTPTIQVTLVGALCVTTVYILIQPLKRMTGRLKGVLALVRL